MKTKVRVTRVYEYEMDPTDYPNCSSDEERLEIDRQNFEEYGIEELTNLVSEKIEVIKE